MKPEKASSDVESIPADDGIEIISNLIAGIRLHGNYSPESTILFLSQALQALQDSRYSLAKAMAALTLAEDVLSRAPFSTGIWPNGMNPQIGIDQIRSALTGT